MYEPAKVGIQPSMSQTSDPSRESAEVQAVLASQAFSKSPNLAKLLNYLCNRYFSGSVEGLNEYRIGVEALGRPTNFDPATNSIVRVEIHRLRERLRKYYENEGSDHALRIVLKAGCYTPLFVRQNETTESVSQEIAGVSLGVKEEPGGDGEPAGTARSKDGTSNGASLSAAGEAGAHRRQSLSWGSRWKLVVGSVVVVAVVLASVLALAPRKSGNAVVTPGAAAVTPVPPAPGLATVAAPGDSVRILAGYPKAGYVDREGKEWGGDRFFSGGEAIEQSFTFLQGTPDPTIFRTARLGEFTYNIPLRAGNYELRLYFAETTFGPGTVSGRGESSRVFFVTMNSHPLLSNFDVLSAADGNNQAYTRTFKDVSPGSDGQVHLTFHRKVDQPFVNAIELVPAVRGKMNPIRIVAQENSYTDRAGRLWEPDHYAKGGLLVTHGNAVSGVVDSHLFDGERFGHFSYGIPVAPGRYAVTLYFAETYLVPGGVEGETSRLFDVYANGEAVLRNFDILKEAGGTNRALRKTFHGLEPNAAGLIVLNFVPIRNYACVNAIEVSEESQ
jgi:hypothetical protein